jgi:transcriptional regulator with XRE-family HTH domain
MIDSPAQIGKRLKALRKKNQLTQQAMADALGITQPQWNQYETGKRQLTIEVAAIIATNHGVTLDWLYLGDPSGLPLRMADLAQSAA